MGTMTNSSYNRTPLTTTATQVNLGKPLKTPRGNVIATAGLHNIVEVEEVVDGGHRYIAYTIDTPEHYAGCSLTSLTLRAGDTVVK